MCSGLHSAVNGSQLCFWGGSLATPDQTGTYLPRELPVFLGDSLEQRDLLEWGLVFSECESLNFDFSVETGPILRIGPIER